MTDRAEVMIFCETCFSYQEQCGDQNRQSGPPEKCQNKIDMCR